MGAWGEDIFENDEAGDFAAEVVATKDLSRVEEALDSVLHCGEYLEAPVASEGLAAADIVARLRGYFGQTDAYTENLDAWVKKSRSSPSGEVVQKALAVVERVRTEPSELLELWSEDDAAAWLTSLENLKQRLVSAASSMPDESSGGLLQRLRHKLGM